MYRSTMADIIDVTGLQREVERRAGTSGVRCHFSDKVQVAHIKGDTIYLPRLPVPFNMQDFLIIRMSYIHELAHWNSPTVKEVFKLYPKLDMKSNLGNVWNIVQDELDERAAAEAYPGDRKALGEGHAVLLERQLKWLKKHIAETGEMGLQENDIKRLAVYCMAQSTRDWDTYSGPLLTAALRTFPHEVQELTITLIKEGWGKKVVALKDAHEAIALSAEIVKRLWPEEDPEEQLEKAKGSAGGGGKGSGKDEGNEEGEGEGGDGAGDEDAKGAEQEGENTDLTTIPWDRLMYAQHSDGDTFSAHASRIDWTGKHRTSDGFAPASPDQFRILKVHR